MIHWARSSEIIFVLFNCACDKYLVFSWKLSLLFLKGPLKQGPWLR